MKFAVIVPYRDRQEHLDQFIPAMRAFVPEATIIIVEQEDNGPFNRAKLINCGFRAYWPEWFAIHDVDKIPIEANYSNPGYGVRQICSSPYQAYGYLGGVTVFGRDAFEKVNGFSNNFWGWGGEDNELYNQCTRFGVPISYLFGTFKDLPHPRPAKEFDQAKWRQSMLPRKSGDGLHAISANMKGISVENNVIRLAVDLLPPSIDQSRFYTP